MEIDPRRLPDFVWRALPAQNFGVPLLMFHWLAPEQLEQLLLWLKAAGYRSLKAAEVAAVASGGLTAPPRTVALTFDDGVYNNWAVVAPLFRRHGFNGIAFVVPLLLQDRGLRPNLQDAEAGRVTRASILDDAAAGRYMTWDEVIQLDAEGVLEIESHSYDHAQVFTSDELLDFQHPDASGAPRYPWLWSACGGVAGEPMWGAPVYPTAPRFAGRRYHDDPGFRDACRRFVAIRGERGYFADTTWRAELTRFARLERGRFGPGRLESREDTTRERLLSLRRSRSVLGERLGRNITQVALPWSHAAADAPRLIREAGYQVGYTRESPSYRLRAGADPRDLARVEGYWLESLPGASRLSLAGRVRRTLQRQPLFRNR